VISYSAYLLHPLVMLRVLVGDGVVRLAIWMALTVLLAAASYRFVERPCIALGRRLTGGEKRPGLSDMAAPGEPLAAGR
jgi:peptidoglycan/LPS O-acetylase OafA/YrhL